MGKLTAAGVKANFETGIYGDGDGLYLQVQSATRRSWLFRFTSPRSKKKREMGLGAYPETSLAEARVKLAEARALIRAGTDPIDARKAAAAPAAPDNPSGLTLRQAGAAFIAGHRAGWRNPKHAAQWTATLTTYAYPTHGDRITRELRTADIHAIVEPIWNTKNVTATRLRERLEAVIDYAKAMEDGWDGRVNPAIWRGNLSALLPRPGAVHKARNFSSLPYIDAPAFLAAVMARQGVGARALEFAVLTGNRSRPVRSAHWPEIDLIGRVWNVPEAHMKKGEDFTVPLSAAAVALLERMLPLRNAEHGDFVFPSTKRGKPLSENTMTAVMLRMGVDPKIATVHGFRATLRTWASEETDHQPDVAEAVLDHALEGGKVRAAYQRGDLLKKRRALTDDWCDFLMKPATTKE